MTKWCHNVTGKSGCFPAYKKGDFLENPDVLKLTKMGPFWGLLSGSLELDQLASLAQNSLVLMTNKASEICEDTKVCHVLEILLACLYKLLKTGVVAQGGPGRVKSK